MRAALEQMAERCVEALAARDPGRLTLAKDARYTENGVELPLGRGLWRTASGLRDTYRLTVADPEAGQAVHFRVIEENGDPVFLVVRIRADGKTISQIEALVARDPESAGAITPLDPSFFETVPANMRTPREEMHGLADRYFDAIEISDAGDLQFDPRCTRRENGDQSTSNPGRTEDFVGDGFHGYALDCKAQFATRMWSFIEAVTDRRHVAVDEARGLLVDIVSFQHPGLPTSFTAPSGAQIAMPGYGRRPSTFVIAELFKFEAGCFRQIEVIGVPLPYGASQGW
ncbi:MAG: hypothetical protein WDM92_04245 [Caulobacteraceae bacterium]